MDLRGVISTVHAFVEIGDLLCRHFSQRDCDLAENRLGVAIDIDDTLTFA